MRSMRAYLCVLSTFHARFHAATPSGTPRSADGWGSNNEGLIMRSMTSFGRRLGSTPIASVSPLPVGAAGSIATNAEVATQAAPGIFVPQLLFAGFFIQASQIPVWLRWAQYLCSLKYAMNLYILNEFGEQTSAGWDAEYKAMAETFISSNDIEPDQWWVYMLILILIPCGFRFLSILVLQYRAKSAF